MKVEMKTQASVKHRDKQSARASTTKFRRVGEKCAIGAFPRLQVFPVGRAAPLTRAVPPS